MTQIPVTPSPDLQKPVLPGFLRSPAFWAGYVCVLVLLTVVLWYVRTLTLAGLDNPQAAAEWQDWERIKREKRLEREQQAAGGHPITRGRERKPSDEPPHLVILRDYFPGVLISLAIVSTAFYVFLWNVVRGVLTGSPRIDLLPPDVVSGPPAR